MKRKANETEAAAASTEHHSKKPAIDANGMQHRFGDGIFAPATLERYTHDYATSEPYKHAVVSGLIDDSLLRSVRTEILENIHFTPKETDIYKIHQSGDLANLDGLPASALAKLPSLLQLRDALYSYEFRRWISQVSGAGPVSGKKTDMAVNVYVPGCHLLCHDDVIGSRRVSYILYLTDPDQPWKAEWGGSLRLYPTDDIQDGNGEVFKVPQPSWSRVIPPAWNQLSFFAVQPGQSFHDVEEVYKRAAGDTENDGGRVRMAISGWFHIPQEGEEGYESGLEEKLAEKSSLKQLQGNAAQLDEPQVPWHDPELPREIQSKAPQHEEDLGLTEADLDFLLQYMTPSYLTPETVEVVNEMFVEESLLQLSNFLNPKFAERFQKWLEHDSQALDEKFQTSRPPHKHRYQYIASEVFASSGRPRTDNPFEMVLNDLFPSLPFHKWLSLATGLSLKRCSVIARRFRRGVDYQLAQGFEGEDPQLEYCLCVTPSQGWGGDNDDTAAEQEEDNLGGYELIMAGEDEPEPDEGKNGSEDGVEIPAKISSHTGAGDRRNAKRQKADPAVYKAAADDEDDGILVSNPVSWNTLSVVLRDRGTLKFVKYVSRSAPADRWDFAGCVEVEPDDEDVEAEEEEDLS